MVCRMSVSEKREERLKTHPSVLNDLSPLFPEIAQGGGLTGGGASNSSVSKVDDDALSGFGGDDYDYDYDYDY